MESEKRCILFHAIDGIGLGHVSRSISIALAVRELDPSPRLLFVVEGGSHGLLEAAKLPYVAFPSPSNLDSEVWSSWSESQKEGLAESLAEAVIEAARPSLIVFDCFPGPSFVAVARRRGIPYAVCVRKSKDAADYFNVLGSPLRGAELIIVPHAPGEVKIPDELVEKTHFVGPVVRPTPETSDEVSRNRRRRIIITGGGGGYPGTAEFYNLTLDAVGKCRRTDSGLEGLLVTGPLFREWDQLRPADGVRIVPFDPHITAAFRDAALVICQAGYNTVAEVVAAGATAICVPAERRFDDQHERAKATAREHRQFHLWEDRDSDSLSAYIFKLLQTTDTFRSDAATSEGSRLAARVIVESMNRD
jgi:UDP-N-acetylglucosamine--N-acetylmuramyl-(pentapeptide) pyrophosphoryl-undecaprenol N-acetylglucosamine transferase